MSRPHTGRKKKLQGIPVSAGIIIGKAHVVDREKVKILYQYLINDDYTQKEVERFKDAVQAAERQLTTLKNGMPDHVKEHVYILDSHMMILKDSMFSDATIRRIQEEKINAEWALKKSIEEIRDIFNQIDDTYISNRISDVENVAQRVFRNLSGKQRDRLGDIDQRMIIVAHDLSPADTTELNIAKVMGFITDVGGRTSHTAIMAQALEIPAVVALEFATDQVEEGDLLIVDGNSGEVIVNPDETDIIHYNEKQIQHEKYKSSVARTSHLPAVTSDGRKIATRANIEFLQEVNAAKEYGGEGIGLYRTEFLYLRSKGLPSEEDLFEDYKEAASASAPEPVTIRTLDLGGDKFMSELDIVKELNPALGLRAIRFCLKEPEMFKNQLRAILKASAYGTVQLMFPMISGLQEVLDAKRIMDQVKDELDHKNIDYDHDIKIGCMIEIPSAVAIAEILARHVDFFSIGTNDLIQYSLAIDRVNEHVAYMYQPFHPAIIKMIQQVVEAARSAGIGVSLCGEMAGDPLSILILLGLGINDISMNARLIPLIRSVIRSISMKEAEADLKQILKLNTAEEVRAYVVDRMRTLVPDLEGEGYFAG